MVFEINANSDGRMARSLGNQVHTALALQFVAYVVPKRSAIVHSSDPIPLSQRMQLVAIQQRLRLPARHRKAVQAPLPVDNPDFKQEPVVDVLSGCRVQDR